MPRPDTRPGCRCCCCATAIANASRKASAPPRSWIVLANCRGLSKSSALCRSRGLRPAHVVNLDRLGEPLQLDIADLLQREQGLDGTCHPLADQDLAVLGLVAETRGDIAHRPDRGVIDPLGKADLAQGGVALRDTDPE